MYGRAVRRMREDVTATNSLRTSALGPERSTLGVVVISYRREGNAEREAGRVALATLPKRELGAHSASGARITQGYKLHDLVEVNHARL